MVNFKVLIPSIRAPFWRVASGGQGGNAPRFSFLPPPIYFLPPHGIFLGGRNCCFLAGKNVEICDFRQKKASDFGEDLFFLRSPGFGRKICDFDQKKPSDFGEDLFFGDHLVLAGKKR